MIGWYPETIRSGCHCFRRPPMPRKDLRMANGGKKFHKYLCWPWLKEPRPWHKKICYFLMPRATAEQKNLFGSFLPAGRGD